jgi:hypothetical protein
VGRRSSSSKNYYGRLECRLGCDLAGIFVFGGCGVDGTRLRVEAMLRTLLRRKGCGTRKSSGEKILIFWGAAWRETGCEKICSSVHIFLASHTIRRILIFANSLQANNLRERGSLMEDATKN